MAINALCPTLWRRRHKKQTINRKAHVTYIKEPVEQKSSTKRPYYIRQKQWQQTDTFVQRPLIQVNPSDGMV